MKRASPSSGRARVRGRLLAAMLLAGAMVGTADRLDADERTSCALEPGPTRAVTSVVDAETLTLDDGTEVRLIGALAPRPPDATLDVSFWPPERDAKAALERLVLGHSVTLAFSGRRSDRYGRTLAHVFLEPDEAGDRPWVQARMLAAGHARAFVVKDSLGCLRELAAHEAIARQAGAGLWAHAAYQARDASRAPDLMHLRSTFQIVEGEVTAVLPGRTALILRFGREGEPLRDEQMLVDDAKHPARGFSIAIKPAIARGWSAGGLTLDQTTGRRLRIRGWIERRGGPAIEILDAHQIELVEIGASVSLSSAGEPTPARRRSRRASRETAAVVPVAQE